MTGSVQDLFDDSSFYIGVQGSESICDSDISETNSEFDDNDDGEFSESEEGMINVDSEGCSSGSARLCGTVIGVPLLEMADDCACCLLDHKNLDKSVDGSLETGLTIACSSETDTVEDASSHVLPVNDGSGHVNCAIENDDDEATLDRIRFECERLELETHNVIKFSREWFCLKAELVELNIILDECADDEEEPRIGIGELSLHSVSNSEHDTIEDFLSCHGEEESRFTLRRSTQRDASNTTLDELIIKPPCFSARLVAMTHVST